MGTLLPSHCDILGVGHCCSCSCKTRAIHLPRGQHCDQAQDPCSQTPLPCVHGSIRQDVGHRPQAWGALVAEGRLGSAEQDSCLQPSSEMPEAASNLRERLLSPPGRTMRLAYSLGEVWRGAPWAPSMVPGTPSPWQAAAYCLRWVRPRQDFCAFQSGG